MKLNLLTACMLAGLACACGSGTEPQAIASAAGRYRLASVDGAEAGDRTEELALHDSGTYVWRSVQVVPNYYQTTATLSTVSAGQWVQDGAALTLVDPNALARVAGRVHGDTVTVDGVFHTYQFLLARPEHLDGAFVLSRLDGSELPLALADSAGVRRTVDVGVLQLASYATHALDLLETTTYPNGSSTTAWVRVSSGPYHWDGATLTLQDQAGAPALSGEWLVSGVVFALQGAGHEFEFVYSTELPRY